MVIPFSSKAACITSSASATGARRSSGYCGRRPGREVPGLGVADRPDDRRDRVLEGVAVRRDDPGIGRDPERRDQPVGVEVVAPAQGIEDRELGRAALGVTCVLQPAKLLGALRRGRRSRVLAIRVALRSRSRPLAQAPNVACLGEGEQREHGEAEERDQAGESADFHDQLHGKWPREAIRRGRLPPCRRPAP